MVNASTAKLSSMHFHGWEQGKDSSGGEVHITCLKCFVRDFVVGIQFGVIFVGIPEFSPMKWGILQGNPSQMAPNPANLGWQMNFEAGKEKISKPSKHSG